MSPLVKLAAFAAALAALFGLAAAAGGALDPDRDDAPRPQGMAASADEAPAAGHAGDDANGADDGAGHGGGEVRGLAVAADGLRLELATTTLPRGRAARLAFRIVDRDGRPVRAFDRTHERRMHVIVVRRDLHGFRHLHPRMAADGTWSTALRLDDAGAYRVFADFSHDGAPRTLAADLHVDGPVRHRPLPATRARSDGGDAVALAHGPLTAGRDATLRFAIDRDGAPVALERYLGAAGHLVALREGDLAFLHVHPAGHDDVGSDHVAFATAFPSPGRYRLFLQYQVAGRVETAAVTVEVAR